MGCEKDSLGDPRVLRAFINHVMICHVMAVKCGHQWEFRVQNWRNGKCTIWTPRGREARYPEGCFSCRNISRSTMYAGSAAK